MKVVIAGGNSYLGQVLARHYAAAGNEVVLLVRRVRDFGAGIRSVYWDGQNPGEWARELEGASLLVNMAGRTVNCRYNEKNKKEIMDSRIDTASVLGQAVKACLHPPQVWLNAASATLYRHAEDRPMDEYTGETGTGFSVEVCRRWEQAFFAQHTPGTRKAALRTAIVFGPKDGVYIRLRNLARCGLGGRQGNGRQMVSWIHEADFAAAVDWIYRHKELEGAVNLSAPVPLRNDIMMRKIRKSAGIPFGLPATRFLLEIGAVLIGTETELILKSRWVLPARLTESGFTFRYPTLEDALPALE